MELIGHGYENVICAQPFGCLPNHIVGKGMIRKIRTMLPEAAESFSSERIVCLCHVVDLWACIVALFEAPTPLSISKLRRLAASDMPLILLSSEIMEKESDFRIIEL